MSETKLSNLIEDLSTHPILDSQERICCGGYGTDLCHPLEKLVETRARDLNGLECSARVSYQGTGSNRRSHLYSIEVACENLKDSLEWECQSE